MRVSTTSWIVAGIFLATPAIALPTGESFTGEEWLRNCETTSEPQALKDCNDKLVMLYRQQERARTAFAIAALECSKETEPAKMRECLDDLSNVARIALKTVAETTIKREPTASAWLSTETTSKMDDSRSSITVRAADEDLLLDSGQRVRPLLSIRCVGGATSLLIDTRRMFLAGNAASVTTRLDADKAVPQKWAVSNTSTSVGLWNGAAAIPFIKSMAGHAKLLVKIEPFRGGSKEMEFTLDGLAAAIEPIRANCKW